MYNYKTKGILKVYHSLGRGGYVPANFLGAVNLRIYMKYFFCFLDYY